MFKFRLQSVYPRGCHYLDALPSASSRTRSTRLKASFSLVLVMLLSSVSALTYPETSATEPKLRAAIIYRLLQQSGWQTSIPDRVKICEIGNGYQAPALKLLNDVALNKTQNITVSSLPNGDIKLCDVIIIGPEIVKLANQDFHEKFIVCNSCETYINHSVIHLYLHNDQLRYDVDLENADSLGVHIRSDVLKLAQNFRGRK